MSFYFTDAQYEELVAEARRRGINTRKLIKEEIPIPVPAGPLFPKPGIGSVITNIRLAKDICPRIGRVLHGGELRSDFVRAASDAELQRREREAALEQWRKKSCA